MVRVKISAGSKGVSASSGGVKISNSGIESTNPNTKRLTDNLKKIGKPMPNGMEPRGNGWYGSPDVVDPRDCNNYKNSIYCGGNPFSRPDKLVDIKLDWGVNGCGVYGSAAGNIAGLGLPTHTRAWIREECRKDYEQKQIDLKDPPPRDEQDFRNDYKPEPGYAPNGFDPDDIVCVATSDSYYREEHEWLGNNIGWAINSTYIRGQVRQALYPTGDLVDNYDQLRHPGQSIAVASMQGKAIGKSFMNSQFVWFYHHNSPVSFFLETPPDPNFSTEEIPLNLRIPKDQPDESAFYKWRYQNYPEMLQKGGGRYQQLWHFFTDYGSVLSVSLWVGRFGDIFPDKQISPISYGVGTRKDARGRVIGKQLIIHERFVEFCKKADGYPPFRDPHYDSPPPPKRDCCMTCCSPGQQQQNNNDAILRLILQKLTELKSDVDQLKQKVGTSLYPIPCEAPDGTDFPVSSLTGLVSWYGRRLSEYEKTLARRFGVSEYPYTLPPASEGEEPGKAENLKQLLDWYFAHIQGGDNEEIKRILMGDADLPATDLPGDRPPASIAQLIKWYGKKLYDTIGVEQFPLKIKEENDTEREYKTIAEITKKTSQYLGIRDVIKVPEHLTTEYDDKGNKKQPKIIELKTLTDFQGWLVKGVVDPIMGEMGIGFWLDDADPTKEGDQSKFFYFPNMAELLADLYALQLQQYMNQYDILQLVQRHSIETMLSKKVGLQNFYSLDAIIDYLGFKRTETTKEIPFVLDIEAEDKSGLKGYMKETVKNIQITQFMPDAKTSPSFKDDMLRIKRASAMIESRYGIKFKDGADIALKLMDRLQKSNEHHNSVNNDKYDHPKKTVDDDFDEWLENAENEFQYVRLDEGTATTQPYGRPYGERPRLRRVGTDQDTDSPAGGS